MKTHQPTRGHTKPYAIGWRAFAKISAIEGICLSEEAIEDFCGFEREGLSPEARRQAIYRKYAKVQ